MQVDDQCSLKNMHFSISLTFNHCRIFIQMTNFKDSKPNTKQFNYIKKKKNIVFYKYNSFKSKFGKWLIFPFRDKEISILDREAETLTQVSGADDYKIIIYKN